MTKKNDMIEVINTLSRKENFHSHTETAVKA